MIVPCFRGHFVDKHGDVWLQTRGQLMTSNSSSLSFVKLLITLW